jgi:hypothetical protein
VRKIWKEKKNETERKRNEPGKREEWIPNGVGTGTAVEEVKRERERERERERWKGG